MDDSALQLVSEIGTQLSQQSRPNKYFLVKSLRQAESALSHLEQPSPEATRKPEVIKKLEAAIKPLSKSLVKHGLLQHTDKEIRLLVAICVGEIFRVLAPEPPFEDKYLRDIFKLLVSVFVELADTTSPFFSRRAKILETIARCKCCILMLDIDCDDLVLEMFNIFFSVVSEHHQQNLINDILSIMTHILNEEASQSLLDVILRNLVKERKGGPSAPSQLAVSVIQACAEKLEPFVCGFLSSCILHRDGVGSELKEVYHEIIFKIFQCAPQMLLVVIPNLTQELLTDQVDVRIKAVNLIGKLVALPEHHVAQKYRDLFIEFLKRFSDKSVDVRVSALQCAKACYMANPSGTESHEILSALEGRLLDFDDRVRTQAVIVACDLARSKLKYIPPKLISQVVERLRDKKISVRKKAFQKLIEVYQDYCKKCSEGHMTISDLFEQIPCKILKLCYDKDCKEFSFQNMELVLAENLFPSLLSVEERTRHWIHLFSLFTPHHVKALDSILSQKRRLQTEMQVYLALRKKEKDISSEEMQKRIKASFMKMSACYPDPCKAEESFHKLNQMKDNRIFDGLALLLDELTIINAPTNREIFLKMIGDSHPHFEFLQSLSSKCLFSIFSSEHVRCIVDHLSNDRSGNKHLQASSLKLLQAIISIFPPLLRGSEVQFQMLLEESYPIKDELIEVLAKAGPHISIQLSDIYPFLEKICLEGTRTQSKFAVSAIAAIIGSSEQFLFAELYKGLVDSLCRGQNIPTVLQSLGCLAQYSVSTFETQDKVITAYIYKKIFQAEPSDDLTSFSETFGCSNSCKLKIYGLKALVKSFLPHRGTHVRRQINELMDVLSIMLQKGETVNGIISCEGDRANIRLAAAKSVLRLSRRWDLHFTPEIFHFTILMAKDSSSFVRRLYLDKTHKLLKEHLLPIRYACAFTLATSDGLKDLQNDSFKFMAEFIKKYTREARIRQTSTGQGGSITDYPAYIVVFLIHVLAHDKDFPPEDCQGDEVFAQFCSPLFFALHALVNASIVNGEVDVVKDAVLYLLSIFRAIKRAEDAVDAQRTPRLHILADIGISIVNALNQSGISSSHAPGLILLPSSLFKISSVKKSNEANSKYLTGSALDENFVKRVIHIFQSHLSSDGSQYDVIQYSRLNLLPCKKADLSTTRTTEHPKRQETSMWPRKKQALSSGAPGPIILHSDSSTVEQKNDVAKSFEPVLEKEKISSCDSVTTRPSLTELQVSIRNGKRNDCPMKENEWARSNIISKPSKSSRAGPKDHYNLKGMSNKSEALIGQRIKIWSPIDGRFYSGNVDGFNSQNNTHKILYESGDVELLCLDSETWETISDGSLTERVMEVEGSNTFDLRHCDPGEHSSRTSEKETVDPFGNDTTQLPIALPNDESGKFSNRSIPRPVKRKTRQKVSVDMSVSEVTNMNEDAIARRTRRRKG